MVRGFEESDTELCLNKRQHLGSLQNVSLRLSVEAQTHTGLCSQLNGR